jgi:hypothetical protein
MHDVGFWQGMAMVLGGKGTLRLIIQPAMAIILGARLGLADWRNGAEPFLMGLVHAGKDRRQQIRTALRQIVLPLSMAFVVDCILQWSTLGRVRPLAALIVGGLLVAFPFTLVRGFTNRWMRRRRHHAAPQPG